MLPAQIGEDRVEMANEFDVHATLLIRRNLVPPRLGPIPVVIPFEKGNIVFGKQLVKKRFHVIAHIVASQIEYDLVALFRTRASGEMQHPIGMLAVKIRVRIDHFRLDPQTKIHSERVNLVDQWFQAMRKLRGIDVPVAQPGMVVFALSKPAVVHHESIHTDGGGLLSERHLTGFIDFEFRGLPGVVDHGTGSGGRRVWQNLCKLKVMQQSRSASQTMVGIPAIKKRRLQTLAGI